VFLYLTGTNMFTDLSVHCGLTSRVTGTRTGLSGRQALINWIKVTGVPVSFARNEEIYGQQEPADRFYKVISGSVRTYRTFTRPRPEPDIARVGSLSPDLLRSCPRGDRDTATMRVDRTGAPSVGKIRAVDHQWNVSGFRIIMTTLFVEGSTRKTSLRTPTAL
jgi:hypothetical protein